MNNGDLIKEIFGDSIRAKESFLKDPSGPAQVSAAAEMIIKCYRAGGKVIIFGNGGSASDSQHMAAELVVRFEKERGSLPCVSLDANTANITAIGNDYGFDMVYSRQVESMAGPGDVVVAISTSGTSPNVINGVKAARKNGASVIALTGRDGGELAPLSDVPVVVRDRSTARIQETHILIIHILCKLVDNAFSDR